MKLESWFCPNLFVVTAWQNGGKQTPAKSKWPPEQGKIQQLYVLFKMKRIFN